MILQKKERFNIELRFPLVRVLEYWSTSTHFGHSFHQLWLACDYFLSILHSFSSEKLKYLNLFFIYLNVISKFEKMSAWARSHFSQGVERTLTFRTQFSGFFNRKEEQGTCFSRPAHLFISFGQSNFTSSVWGFVLFWLLFSECRTCF